MIPATAEVEKNIKTVTRNLLKKQKKYGYILLELLHLPELFLQFILFYHPTILKVLPPVKYGHLSMAIGTMLPGTNSSKHFRMFFLLS